MENTECPHCHQMTIRPAQRFATTFWKNIHCDACGGRSCSHPVGQALMYFALTWDIFFFGFLGFYEDVIYFIPMMIGWAILQFFMYYIPLARMRPKKVKS